VRWKAFVSRKEQQHLSGAVDERIGLSVQERRGEGAILGSVVDSCETFMSLDFKLK
jgi:hypothetical protein